MSEEIIYKDVIGDSPRSEKPSPQAIQIAIQYALDHGFEHVPVDVFGKYSYKMVWKAYDGKVTVLDYNGLGFNAFQHIANADKPLKAAYDYGALLGTNPYPELEDREPSIFEDRGRAWSKWNRRELNRETREDIKRKRDEDEVLRIEDFIESNPDLFEDAHASKMAKVEVNNKRKRDDEILLIEDLIDEYVEDEQPPFIPQWDDEHQAKKTKTVLELHQELQDIINSELGSDSLAYSISMEDDVPPPVSKNDGTNKLVGIPLMLYSFK